MTLHNMIFIVNSYCFISVIVIVIVDDDECDLSFALLVQLEEEERCNWFIGLWSIKYFKFEVSIGGPDGWWVYYTTIIANDENQMKLFQQLLL